MLTPSALPEPNPATAQRVAATSGRPIWLVGLVFGVAALVGYFSSLRAPFVFDDIPAIEQNASIRDLGRPSALVLPSAVRGSGVAGRPVVNLSLALNRAIGGQEVIGYHLFNVLVHLSAGLLLYGVLRRTLGDGARKRGRDSKGGPRTESSVEAVVFFVPLLWLVHPLQTESVTCVIQRTESLLGLFYLMTFYCFVRSTQSSRRAWMWRVGCVAGAALGAATKEVMVTAPVLLFLFDRTFVGGSFKTAWRERGRLHLTLAGTVWMMVAFFLWQSDIRGGTVGFGHGVAWWEYGLTQCRAVVMYLQLALWPHPLVLDYGTTVVRDWQAVWLPAGALLVLLIATAWALVRAPRIGFLGAWFFGILAPSSSVVPLVTQTMAEHRMYLPLAAILTGLVLGFEAVAGRRARMGLVVLTAGFLTATIARNVTYRSDESIWRDTAAKAPDNPRAHHALAQLADSRGHPEEAVAEDVVAVHLLPNDATAHFNLGFSLAKAGRVEEAAAEYRKALQLRPDLPDAHINLSVALARLNRIDEAIAEGETVVRLLPDSSEDHFNLGALYYTAGRTADAAAQFMKAVALKPDSASAWHRLGNARIQLADYNGAVAAYREAVRLEPGNFEAQVNLAGALLKLGRPAEAIPVYEAALRLQPGNALVLANLAAARDAAGR
jgi:protein O-mannosyl-transferase